jgi:hypothetical protein
MFVSTPAKTNMEFTMQCSGQSNIQYQQLLAFSGFVFDHSNPLIRINLMAWSQDYDRHMFRRNR